MGLNTSSRKYWQLGRSCILWSLFLSPGSVLVRFVSYLNWTHHSCWRASFLDFFVFCAWLNIYCIHTLYIMYILYVYTLVCIYLAGRRQWQRTVRQQFWYTSVMSKIQDAHSEADGSCFSDKRAVFCLFLWAYIWNQWLGSWMPSANTNYAFNQIFFWVFWSWKYSYLAALVSVWALFLPCQSPGQLP